MIPSLPVELLVDIVSYLTPHIPITGAWTRPCDLLNWWDGQYWKSQSTAALYSESDSPTDSSVEIAVSPYASLLALLQANRQFNAICVPLLYKDFNCLEPRTTDKDVAAAEVLSLYHCHVRTVRTIAWPQKTPLFEKAFGHFPAFLTQGVTTLAVYFDGSDGGARNEIEWFIDEIVRVMDTGRITSFRIYSTLAFSLYTREVAPYGASSLLQRIIVTTPLLSCLLSLDIVVEAMDEGPYDALRSQIGPLDPFTLRDLLQDDLGKVWDMKQRHKWFPCNNLTNLQLIRCPAVSTPHIPYVLQLFPSLRHLTLVACGDPWVGDPPKREKGWSLTQDPLWTERAPLEGLHIELMFASEIVTLGVIHTQQLTIATVSAAGFIPFQDEELYPGLQVLRTDDVYINSDLEEICTRRGIVLESNARAVLSSTSASNL